LKPDFNKYGLEITTHFWYPFDYFVRSAERPAQPPLPPVQEITGGV
jgi:hypothetical protein